MRRIRRYTKNKTTKTPLIYKNPFRSTGVKQRASHVYVGPMRREGITSVENAERERLYKHLSQLSNAGMIKQMRELGIIPDDVGVNMSQFSGNLAALPNGVTSLEQVQKEADVMRQIEQYNAGILNQEHSEQKALMELAKKRKQSEYRKKIIQWLAETDEMDEVPLEFKEEVEDYYKNNPTVKKDDIEAKRKKRKEEEEKKATEKYLKQMYWQSDPFSSVLQPSTLESTRYSDNPGLLTKEVVTPTFMPSEEDIITPEIKEVLDELYRYVNVGDITFDGALDFIRLSGEINESIKPFVIEYFRKHYNTGNGVIHGGSINGWRAPRLHKLVRPLKRFMIEENPDKIIEDQKQALDDRRAMYKDEQTFQRGTTPPKDMIERAMPKLAEPILAKAPFPQVFTRPDFGITLHPFVFPKKKYMVQTGMI